MSGLEENTDISAGAPRPAWASQQSSVVLKVLSSKKGIVVDEKPLNRMLSRDLDNK